MMYAFSFLFSSGRPFTPTGHWLVNEQIDIDSFIQAATCVVFAAAK